MLLILTNSFDGTTDLLIPRLSAVPIFRLNTDLIGQYSISISNEGWLFRDAYVREATSHSVVTAYWRKPYTEEFSISVDPPDEGYARAELKYALDSIITDLCSRGKFVLVEPRAERRMSKFAQLELARDYFPVPPWVFTCNVSAEVHPLRGTRTICKSLSSKEVSDESVLYTTEVEASRLNLKYPWFTQTLIDATEDVTVAYVAGEMWTLQQKVKRHDKVVDWRISQKYEWTPCDLPGKIRMAVRSFMERAGLRFGRLDFVRDGEQRLWFLEVNPNGQVAWMDLDGQSGLLKAVVTRILAAYQHEKKGECERNMRSS